MANFLDSAGLSHLVSWIKGRLSSKQDTLVSGTNIKTVGGTSVLGSGDISAVIDASYVHTDNNYTSTEKSKLSGIASGAEVNVQADWSVTTTTSDAYIKNKPDIPSKTSDLTNDSGYITSSAVPTKTSDLTNDSGFVTSSDLTATDKLAKRNSAIWHGTCTTAAATNTKVATLDNADGFALADGVVVAITFSYYGAVSGSTPIKMNVNGTGAKNIVGSNQLSFGMNAMNGWGSGETVIFTYSTLASSWVQAPSVQSLENAYSLATAAMPKSGGTFTGAPIWASDPTANDHLTRKSYVDGAVSTAIGGLATVATSGSYADLSNKPTIPTATSQLTNDSGFIDEDANGDISVTRNINAGGDIYADGRVVLDDNIYNVLTTSTPTSAPSQDKFQPFGRVTHDLATTEEVHLAEFGSVMRATGESQIYLQAANEQNGTRTVNMLFLGVDANGDATVTLHQTAWLNALGLTTTDWVYMKGTSSSSNKYARWRAKAGIVFVEWYFTTGSGHSGSAVTLGTISSGYRPSKHISGACYGTGNNVMWWEISTSGVLTFSSKGSSSSAAVYGTASYPL